MAIIGIGGEKGGCGKSTVAINLAARLSMDGARVALLDADKKPSAQKWHALRDGLPNIADITCKRVIGDIDDAILSMARDHDYLVIDTGGMEGRELRYTLGYSHVFIAPFQPSQFDLDSVSNMNSYVKLARPLNPHLRAFSLLTRVSNQRHSTTTDHAIEFMGTADADQFTLVPSVINELIAYKDCARTGKSVFDMPKEQKAQTNINGLIEAIEVM